MSVCQFSLLYAMWFFQPLYLFFSQSSLCLSITHHLCLLCTFILFCALFFWIRLFILFLCTLWSFGCPGPGKGCSCAPILLPGSGGPQRWKRMLASGVHFDITQLHPSASLIGRGTYLHVVVWQCASTWITCCRVTANQRKAWLQWICMANQWRLVCKSLKNVNGISVGISIIIYRIIMGIF